MEPHALKETDRDQVMDFLAPESALNLFPDFDTLKRNSGTEAPVREAAQTRGGEAGVILDLGGRRSGPGMKARNRSGPATRLGSGMMGTAARNPRGRVYTS